MNANRRLDGATDLSAASFSFRRSIARSIARAARRACRHPASKPSRSPNTARSESEENLSMRPCCSVTAPPIPVKNSFKMNTTSYGRRLAAIPRTRSWQPKERRAGARRRMSAFTESIGSGPTSYSAYREMPNHIVHFVIAITAQIRARGVCSERPAVRAPRGHAAIIAGGGMSWLTRLHKKS